MVVTTVNPTKIGVSTPFSFQLKNYSWRGIPQFPRQNMDQRPAKSYFICKARIVEVLTQNGWYYVSCSRCNKKLENSAASLRCRQYVISNVTENTRSSDDEDSRSGDDDSSSGDDDPSSSDDDSSSVNGGVSEKLPQCIAELGGKEFIFHIRVTPFNFTPTHRTFTVSAISHTINTENYKINESPCVDVKCEEASTSASAIKMSTAEVKQGGCKLPHQLCNIFHLFKKSISTMYLT
ncbi:hypothetical protein Bca4012_071326 [Brassica carinata]